MNLLAHLFGKLSKHHANAPRAGAAQSRRSFRPAVEALEDRTLLNNRFIVPFDVPADNVTYFHTLETALNTGGLFANDTVEIELGSAPGNIINDNLPTVANITIQGNLAASAAEIPVFGVRSPVTIHSSQVGFTLRNVNVALEGGGLQFDANGTIDRSIITSNIAGTAIYWNGITSGVLSNSLIVANNGSHNGVVVLVGTAPGSNNLISGNTIISNASVNHNLLWYDGDDIIADRVTNNAFIGNPGFAASPLILLNDPINGDLSSGLTILGNTISDPDSNQVGIDSSNELRNVSILNNNITLSGASGTVGIHVTGGASGSTIALNQISTSGKGAGIVFTAGGSGSRFNVKVEGNDFHLSKNGVVIEEGGDGPVTGIDLGGGSQGSRGANNFRGYVTTNFNDPTGNAIYLAARPAQGSIQAQRNIFSVANPENAITDANDFPNFIGDVVATNNLAGNAAYVETLYLDFLHRIGDTNNSQDAGYYVGQLNTNARTPAQVANSFVRSPESLGAFVKEYYLRFLFRVADPGGLNSWVRFLQNGHTLEQVQAQFLNSAEYRSKFGSEAAFASSLYFRLLNRNPSQSELNNTINQVRAQGRLAVATSFLAGLEYRRLQVRGFFANLLNRTTPPTQQEVDNWATGSLDLLGLMIGFAGTAEFQANG